MTAHDYLCRAAELGAEDTEQCDCDVIARSRADERERMVRDGWVNPDAYKANVRILLENERARQFTFYEQGLADERVAQAIEVIGTPDSQGVVWVWRDAVVRIARSGGALRASNA